jgi:hypothetical protein
MTAPWSRCGFALVEVWSPLVFLAKVRSPLDLGVDRLFGEHFIPGVLRHEGRLRGSSSVVVRGFRMSFAGVNPRVARIEFVQADWVLESGR